MRQKFFKLSIILAVVFVLAASVGAEGPRYEVQPVDDVRGAALVVQDKNASGVANYIVQLVDAPAASYQGGIQGLAATNPRVNGQSDLQAGPALDAYVAYLVGVQNSFVADLNQALGRSVSASRSFQHAFNGVVVQMSPEEAELAAQIPGVQKIFRERFETPLTDVGPEWIGAPAIWDGSATGTATSGEGVVVAILDTGINHDHPSFADIAGDGYDHTNPLGSGNYIPGSHCDTDPSFCNDKLIGAWDMVNDPGDPTSPEDSNGHGSHTASTVAGNRVEATLFAPTASLTDDISGVAPRANIIAYDVCVASCPSTALLAAVDQVALDHAHLLGQGHPTGIATINYSISGGNDPYNDAVELGFLALTDAGVHVAASAGNSGPGPGTLGHQSPWVNSTGAMTHNRTLVNFVIDMSGGNTTPPDDIFGQSFTAGYGPAAIVYAGDYPSDLTETPELCGVGSLGSFISPWPPGTFSGEIVVCDRGTFGRVEKGANVLFSGAGGMVLADDGNGIVADPHELPATHISQSDGDVLKAWLADGGVGHTATIEGTMADYDPSNGDIMAGFSSRGPNTALDVLKPSVGAPGVSVWAAVNTIDPADPPEYDFISGTSMASPHNAGAAALLTALYPDWSPHQIHSALATTAKTAGMFKEDGVTPTDPFDVGSGRIQVTMAAQAGLVLDETTANFEAADPNLGGDPKTLNISTMMDSACVGDCSFERTVMNPTSQVITWTASFDVPAGVVATVTPEEFTLGPGESQTLMIEFDVSGAASGVWAFGQLNLTPTEPPSRMVRAPQPAPAGYSPALARETVDNAAPAAPPAPTSGAPAPLYITPEAVLYDNGPLITCVGCGSGGIDVSELQSALSLSVFGFGHAVSSGFRVADNFTIPAGETWNIDQITFFAYQTNSGNFSTINHVNFQIWDGPPDEPTSNVVFGDTATNRLAATAWANIYRALDTDLASTARPIMANVATVGTTLGEGDYWIDWQTGGTVASGPWAPPISILGMTTTGDGLQYDPGAMVWNLLLDSGTGTQQGLPFIIEGTLDDGGGGGGGEESFTSNPALAIPDDTYDGTLGSMACDIIDASSIPAGSTITNVTLETGLTHTWVGDLVAKLVSPSGSVLGVFSRPGLAEAADDGSGCCGDSSNLDAAAPLFFSDANADDAETMGNTITSSEIICTDDGRCDYFPNPGAVVGLPNFAGFMGEDPSGDWQLCVGDSVGGDTGTVENWTLTIGFEGEAEPMVSPTHLTFAIQPVTGDVPDLAEINTRRNAGSQVVGPVQGLEVTDLTVEVFGLAMADVQTFDLAVDPTNGDPFDDLDQVYYQIVNVPADSYSLIAELTETTGLDNDLYVGQDTNANGLPDESETVCISATGAALEYCEIAAPAAGDWWVLVQNWLDSGSGVDSITLATAVVPMSDSGNIWVEGPMSVPAGELFDVTVYWNMDMMEGDIFYGAFTLGTDAGNPGNLGTIPVVLYRHADDVTKTADMMTAGVGDTVTYTIVVQPNVTPEDLTYMITDTIPAGMTYVADSATATDGTVSVMGNVLTWTGVMQTAGSEYVYADTASDPACVAPLGTADGDPDGYVNLEAFGILADPAISGDTIDFVLTAGPFEYFGIDQGNSLHFTDDGFVFFEPATPGGTPWVYQTIPTAGDPDNMAAFWWRDWVVTYDAGLNHGVSLATLTSGGVPVASIVEYDDLTDWPGGGSDSIDTEIVIYYTPADDRYEIIFAYDNLNETDFEFGSIGIENGDGSEGIQAYYDNIAVPDGSAICFDWVQATTDPVTITYQAMVNDSACNTTQTNMVEHITDNPGDMLMTTSVDVEVVCVEPAIELAKTVGTDAMSCATGDMISVTAGTTVYYCYTVTNTGNITLPLHDLVDDQLGTILSGFAYDLAPGESVDTVAAGLTISATIMADTMNTATWTAYDDAGTMAMATDSAMVMVVDASIALEKTVGTDSALCAASDTIEVSSGDTVYYCYTVTNTGNITLPLHDLVDDQLGTILSGFAYDLAPGESVDTVAAGLTISATITSDTTNTATWTAYDDTGLMAMAMDSATVTVAPTDVSLSSFGGAATRAWLPAALTTLVVAALGAVALWRRRALR